MESVYPFELYYHHEIKPNGISLFKSARKEDPGAKRMIFIARGAEFLKVAKILEDSTFMNHITGKGFLVTSILYRNIFKQMILEIDFPDNENLEKKIIAEINMDVENYNLIKIVSKHWYKEVL